MIGWCCLRRRLARSPKQHVGPFIARRQPARTDLPLGTWGLSIGANGTLWSGGVDLAARGRRRTAPRCTSSAADRLDGPTSALAAHRAGDGADIFYSYKTNPVPAVLRRLHERGIGAEVISPYELWLAIAPRRAGRADHLQRTGQVIGLDPPGDPPRRAARQRQLRVRKPRSSPASPPRSIASSTSGSASPCPACGADSSASTLRRRTSMRLCAGARRPFGRAPRSALPSRPDHPRRTRRWRAFVADVLALLRGLRAADRLAPCRRSTSVAAWRARRSEPIPTRQFRLNRALGRRPAAARSCGCLTIAEAASARRSRHQRSTPRPRGLAVPRVVLEPGRALTGDTQLLLASVVDVKDDGPLAHAVLDAGINVAEPVPGEYHQLFSVSAPGAPATTPYRLAGPICTPADVLYNHWRLPQLAPGHVLAIMDTGAYFVPFSTTFSFPKPAIAAPGRTDTLPSVASAETFADVVALDESLHPFPRASE